MQERAKQVKRTWTATAFAFALGLAIIPAGSAAYATTNPAVQLPLAERHALMQAMNGHYKAAYWQLHMQDSIRMSVDVKKTKDTSANAVLLRQLAKNVNQDDMATGTMSESTTKGVPVLSVREKDVKHSGGKTTVQNTWELAAGKKVYNHGSKGWTLEKSKKLLDLLPSGDFQGIPMKYANLQDLQGKEKDGVLSIVGTFSQSQDLALAKSLLGNNTSAQSKTFYRVLIKGMSAHAYITIKKVGKVYELDTIRAVIDMKVPFTTFVSALSGQALPAKMSSEFGNMKIMISTQEKFGYRKETILLPKGLPSGSGSTVTGTVYGN